MFWEEIQRKRERGRRREKTLFYIDIIVRPLSYPLPPTISLSLFLSPFSSLTFSNRRFEPNSLSVSVGESVSPLLWQSNITYRRTLTVVVFKQNVLVTLNKKECLFLKYSSKSSTINLMKKKIDNFWKTNVSVRLLDIWIVQCVVHDCRNWGKKLQSDRGRDGT